MPDRVSLSAFSINLNFVLQMANHHSNIDISNRGGGSFKNLGGPLPIGCPFLLLPPFVYLQNLDERTLATPFPPPLIFCSSVSPDIRPTFNHSVVGLQLAKIHVWKYNKSVIKSETSYSRLPNKRIYNSSNFFPPNKSPESPAYIQFLLTKFITSTRLSRHER